MRKGFRKQLSLLIMLTFLITIILPSLPTESASSQTTTKNLLPASSATEKIIANNLAPSLLGDVATFSVPKDAVGSSTNNLLEGSKLYALSEGTTEPEVQIPAANLISAEPVKPEITYGPYQSTDSKQAHAYDPFKKDAPSESGQQSAASFKKDQLLIKMLPNVVQKQTFTAQSVSVPFASQGVLSLEPLLPEKSGKMSALSVNTETQDSDGVWYKAKLQKDTDVLAAASAISSQAGVLAAEPDYIRSTMADGIPDAVTDDRIGEQWQLERSAIKQSWSYLKEQGINPGGSRDVIVAVIDTGVDYTHPDLIGNMWTNSGEIAGNGIDDDHNGYIDDIHGACTVGDRWNGESGDPMDDHGHGTHVAGIIAASAGNGGTAGVAFNVQIMAIKAAQSSGVLTSSDIAQAINYAVQHGADVINMSFGGYGRSTVEEDALQVAFGQAVLVAAAGNNGVGNEPSHLYEKPMFPAAYPWVLGVMAEGPSPAANGDNLAGFSNWDCIPQNSWEYEIMAPGVEILSTLPGGKYAAWSGTSMATPVVSGIAALVRSKYMDKESYSSRFIMGQIASTGDLKQGKTINPSIPPLYYKEVNALKALTETPKPKLSYLEHYVFDKADIAEGNNGDGIVDAGETIKLGIVIRNHWGKADPVQVKIDSIGSGEISDPYVSFVTDTVDYGAVGNFATDDNGFIYTNDVLTGLQHPFQFQVAANTPNDHIIPINITITAKNGFDPADNNDYTSQQQIPLTVRNGVVLPGVISQDMTLTKDKYWIVPNATVIEKGATVTVEPGTQIQFWSSEPEDPYAEKPMAYIQVKGSFLVNGTAEAPVEMFASGLYPGYEVKIFSTTGLDYYGNAGGCIGEAQIKYAKIMNPNLAVNYIDHCYFSQDLFDRMYKRYLDTGEVKTVDYFGPVVIADNICNSRFYQLGCNPYHSETTSWYQMLQIRGTTSGNLFDSCLYYMDEQFAENNVYLKNYKLYGQQYGDRSYWLSKGKNFGYSINSENAFQSVFPVKNNNNGSTYVAVRPNLDVGSLYDQMELVERYANYLGGHIVTINNAEENSFVNSYIMNNLHNEALFRSTYPDLNYDYWSYRNAAIGLNDFNTEGDFKWISGETTDYSNWAEGQPDNKEDSSSPANFVVIDPGSGKWMDTPSPNCYIIEIPGQSYVNGLSMDKTSLTLGAGGGSAQLYPIFNPSTASNKTLQWSSSHPEIATVSNSGLVTPLTIGSTIITATSEDGSYTASCEVTVIEIVPATGINLDQTYIRLVAGQQKQLTATVLPSGATNKNVIWTSNYPEIAQVDPQGKVTAIDNGQAQITATSEDGNYTASCTVDVVVPVTGISLDKTFLSLVAGDPPVTLKAKITPATASDQTVKWQSSNTNVLTVDNGTITPVSEGTALIIVTTTDGNFMATCIVTVWTQAVDFVSTSISTGSNHSLALNDDGTVWAWGSNASGQLGDGTKTQRTTPVQVQNLSGVTKITSSDGNSLALKIDQTVWVWGNNYGNIPRQISDLDSVIDIACGGNSYNPHFLALKNDGTVWARGYNDYGQLGDGSTSNRSTPVQVQNLNDVKAISSGYYHSLALKNDGTVWAWGSNGNGKLGDGSTNNSLIPVQVQNLGEVKAIAAGYHFSMALKTDGTVWAWGYIPHWGEYYSPTPISNLTDIGTISASNEHFLALKNDGTVWSCGANAYGQLGNGTTNGTGTPTQVTNLDHITAISAGGNHSIAVRDDGTVWAWGRNDNGQLGDFSTIDRATPVQTLFGIIPDSEGPNMVSSNPAANATEVDCSSLLVLTFNEAIQQASDFSLINLKDSSNKTLSLKSKSILGNTLTIEPLHKLTANSTYTLCVPARAVKDMFNNDLNSEVQIPFTTGADTQASIQLQQAGYEYPGVLLASLDSTTGLLAAAEILSDLQENEGSFQPLALNERGQDYITQEEIDAARIAFINSGALSTITNNAILNRWWDPDVEHWMRFTSNEGETNKRYLANNYWATTSETLIEKALIHFNDFRNMEEIIYKPILQSPPETAYPFVTDVYVSTETEERASKVGAEKIQVHVLFNRDMDKNIQPQVSFGPDMPTTDYTVNAVEGGWISPRHWVGQFKISPLTGDGYQFFRVAGAVAADDPWLVTGNDSERFRFEIITSGTEAMNLQASGGEGKVSLSWTQDDFDVLAGYNLYRSTTLDGTYTKINSTLIPADQKSYVDTDVLPGQPYYYKFQVVKTDLTVSDFSNVASGTPLDTIAPVIQHQPVLGTAPGLGLTLAADVTDNVRVSSVELYYRKTGTTNYSQKKMVNTTGNRYTATIEGANVQAPGIDYYIQASDGISIVRSGNASSPHQIVITDAPKITSISPLTGPQSGGTRVDITGTNFKNGASVTFDQAVASSVVVESVNRITAVTPAHFPAVVDVCVTNSDGYKDTLLKAFTYISEGIEVSMPSVNANRGQTFELPISITDVEGLLSADISLSFDQDLLAVNSVRLGALTADFILDSNQPNPGKLILALASGTSVNGSGNLAVIEFRVLEGSKTSSALHLEDIKLNSGAITANASEATFTVTNTHSIGGNIYYYSNSQAVNKVDLSLKGLKTYTASSSGGAYSIVGIEKGAYSLSASKSDEATGISAYDAAMVLQASVASVNLSNQQKIAADVDKNGKIDSLDASYVLKQAVGLGTLPFPGQGRVWAFEPTERTYSALENDLTNQNFTGILIGDVSGNWGSSGNGIQSLDAVGFSIEEVYSPADRIVSVPVKIDAGSGNIYAVDLVISYDQNMVTALEVKKSTATTDFVMQVNLTTPGKIRIAMASSQPLSGLAELLNIDFKIIANPGEETIIEIAQAAANEKLASAIQNGKVIIDTSEGCFIATAAYGSYLDPHVWKLRNFRDQVLLQHSWGRWFVRQYYHYSPPVADLIASSDELRLLVRLLLTPLVMAVAFPWAVPILFILVLIVAIPRRLFLRTRCHMTSSLH